MGKTFLIYRVKAKDMEKLEECEKEIRGVKSGEVKDVQRDPIGFGVEMIKAGILVEEKQEGAIEAVTAELNSLESVEEAELEGMTLL
ncbi:MAG: hypothetical protein ABID38_01855 [Candidatus Diapherotrites archaeon]